MLLKRTNTKLKKVLKINILIVLTFVYLSKQRSHQGAGWVQHTAHMERTHLLRGSDEKFCTTFELLKQIEMFQRHIQRREL